MDRRDVLRLIGAGVALAACGEVGWAGGHAASSEAFASKRPDAVNLTEAEWKKVLTPVEFRILREAGTERAFTGDLWDNKRDGVYVCAGCGLPLYDSKTKFKSGTGWPSYWAPIGADMVAERVDGTLGMVRTELLCGRCGGHLGHVFPDGPPPTGMRHCINSFSMDFVPRKHASEVGPVRIGGWHGPGDPPQAPAPEGGAR